MPVLFNLAGMVELILANLSSLCSNFLSFLFAKIWAILWQRKLFSGTKNCSDTFWDLIERPD